MYGPIHMRTTEDKLSWAFHYNISQGMKLPSENACPKQRSKYDFTAENEQILCVPWDLIEMIGLAWEKKKSNIYF